MKRVAVLIGTRPEAIKLAPVVAALAADPDLRPVVISTGQHKEMLRQVIDLFGLHVDHELSVMQPNQTLGQLTGRLAGAIDTALEEAAPDVVLVQGDTTTAFVGALAAFYRRIPVGHVEAGLRTGNLMAPFPEEANRRLVSVMTNHHYAPTQTAAQNLFKEGVAPEAVLVTGNTVIDALQMELARQADPAVARSIAAFLGGAVGEGWGRQPYVVITGHRRENFGAGFEQICEAIRTLAARFREHLFIYPVHLNPRVKDIVEARLHDVRNVRLIAPLDYSAFAALLQGCVMVLTDSGGVQEEAPSLGKPVLVMRETTERPEGVEAGTVALVGTDRDTIVDRTSELLSDPKAYARMATAKNPYGDGRASGRIVAHLRTSLGLPILERPAKTGRSLV